MKKAFTMIELVFVIAVIGILSAVAIPRMAPIIGDAKDTKAKATLSSVRMAIATERQKQILQGIFAGINSLRGSGSGVFSTFNDASGGRVLEYDVEPCNTSTSKRCWQVDSANPGVKYTYTIGSKTCVFELENNRFVDKTPGGCTEITQ